jgi:hypothetical protein
MDNDKKTELDRIIRQYNLNKTDFCIVGSYALNGYIGRRADDIDLCLKPTIRKRIVESPGGDFVILKDSGTINWSDGLIQSASNRYWRIGITDEELLKNPKYTKEYEDYLIVKPEIEYSNKLFRIKEKDVFDTAYLLNNIRNSNSSSNWNWTLVRDFNPVENQKFNNSKGITVFASRIIKKLKFIFANFHQSKRKLLNHISDFSRVNFHHKVDIASIIIDNIDENEILSYLTLLTTEINKLKNNRDIDQAIIISKIINKYEGYLISPLSLLSIVFNNNHFNDEGFYALLNSKGLLLDGGFHIVILLRNNYHQIKIVADNPDKKNIDFIPKEISNVQLIKNNYPSLVINNSGLLFYAIIWSPAVTLESNIFNDIRKKYEIIDSFKLKLSNNDYNDFVHDIYNIDRIEEWKIQKKINFMSLNSIQNDVCIARIFIPNPEFREKIRTKSYLSNSTAILKNEIRRKYKSKIEKYTHDIILHVSDNFNQNIILNDIIDKYKGKNVSNNSLK